MNVKVAHIVSSEQKTSKAGKPYTITTFVGEDGVTYPNIFGRFEVGQDVQGDWKDTEYGRKFEVVKQVPSFSKKDDPQTQKQIIRQNSLTNAVNFVLGKAQFMDKEKALNYITGKEIIQVATYFAKYSEGAITVVTENETPAPAVEVVKAKVEHSDWGRPQEKAKDAIIVEEMLDDIPF